jgi:SAM-dependent methyltransferase
MTVLVRRTAYRASIVRGDFFVLQHLKAFLERALHDSVRPGVRVGDIGCGEQPLRGLVERLGGAYTGVDVQQNVQGTVEVIADICKVSLPDGSFDLVLCTEVLEHVPDTFAAFSELARLCDTGGAIILTTPFAYPLHEEPHDFVRLTPYQIDECARSNGLEIAHLSTSGNELEVVATVWCNLWSRTGALPRSLTRTAWNVLMRLPVNVLMYAMSRAVGSLLPNKYFLNTFCILTKR